MIKITSEQRDTAMRLMRAYGAPDDAIGQAFGLSRQRVHQLIGARPRPEKRSAEYDHADADARLARELFAWRDRRGLTQAQAAERLGAYNQTLISKWETGRGGCALPVLLLRHLELLDKYEPPAR